LIFLEAACFSAIALLLLLMSPLHFTRERRRFRRHFDACCWQELIAAI